jgi:hypothetical protein
MSDPDYSFVEPPACVWCKEDPAEEVDTIKLGTGEVVCRPCLEDMRSWKRPIHFTVLTSTWIEEQDREAISNAAYVAGSEEMRDRGYSGENLGHRLSNAKGVVESEPERDTDA